MVSDERRKAIYKKYNDSHKKESKEYRNKPDVKEHIRKQKQEYRSRPEIKEHIRKQKQEYYKKNRDKILERTKKYNKTHPETMFKAQNKYLNKMGNDLSHLTHNVKSSLISWKKIIQERDKICKICGSNKELQAHHILFRKFNTKLTLNINNGILLCRKHHYEIHKLNGYCR